MKYKVGDRVKIKNDLETYKIYESYGVADDMLPFKGKSVIIKKVFSDSYLIEEDDYGYRWTDEMLEDNKIIKKSQLKGGDIVTYRNGKIRIVDERKNRIVYLNDFDNNSFGLQYFDEDLMHKDKGEDEWDIVEVYRPETKETFTTEKIKEVKEMTLKEVCKELGYEIKIIKE